MSIFSGGIHMAKRFLFGALLLAVAIMSIASRDGRVMALAQHEHEHGTAVDAAAPPQGMHDMMTKMHEAMMAEMKAADARLDVLVKDMNTATGEERIAAVTAVVNELVRQHKRMWAGMAEMQQSMGGRATEGSRPK
jgi:hypothetical protein